MKKIVWKNKSNKQLCVTIPKDANIKEGDIVDIKKAQIKKISYTNVVADLFHYGHLQSIQFARKLSDYNIVGIITDKGVEEYRVKPIANLKERKAVVSNLSCVDRVMVQHEKDPTENLKKIHKEFPNAEIILVHGSNLKYTYGEDYIKSIGGKVVKHPYYERLSNFKIINKIIEQKDKLKDIDNFSEIIKGKRVETKYNPGIKTVISTKADTLKTLKPLLKKSKIEKIFSFSVSNWVNNKQKILDSIMKEFSSMKIVVRSSAISEDTEEESMAGCFDSILNVDSKKEKDIENAIKKVIKSYKQKNSESSFNQVLIQPQTENISFSGVIFTRTLGSNAPYYVINYDDSTGETDTVTKGVENKTVKISRFTSPKNIPVKFRNVITSVKEIESLIPQFGLDIEFAVNTNDEVTIFQARPLTLSLKKDNQDNEIKNELDYLKNRLKKLSKRRNHLAGEKTIFADMPDWNPAEIIGDSPNYLDYSLYDYIITNHVWHEARTSQAYFDVNPAKLVVLFGNKPYVDARNSFNSFVPKTVSKVLREKLVSFYLDKLEKNPEKQDKVEFEIVYTCYDLMFDEKSKELAKAGFSEKEIKEIKRSLIELTNNLIVNKARIDDDLKNLQKMDSHRIKISEKESDDINELLKDAKSLLDNCKKNGTVQFSKIARLGFIGKIMLKSMVHKEIISQEFYDTFMESVSTVAKEISNDFINVGTGKMSREKFIEKYYHLRPGSYDITSLTYKSNPHLLKTIEISKAIDKDSDKFALDKKTKVKMDSALKENGLKFNAEQLLEFARKSLEAREFSKFEFTKNLSDALEIIAEVGERLGFSRKELAMLDVETIFTSKDKEELVRIWKEVISMRMKKYNLNKKIALPPIICSEKDLDVIQLYTPIPNFITQKKIKGELVNLNDIDKENIPKIEGKIIMVENGDPGYDWIFTRNLAGLITKYGGVASHMSIRCAEFGIPAAIGSGALFDQLANAHHAILDCKFKKITPLWEN